MVCKEDVVSWFKELESYKRIDAMCSLLNMCLPFELRFIGTYLEELGKRDFQELRGAEVRANSNADLAADIGGANTDHRTRRKMALYVSLLRSCNYACASTLYNVMVGLEQSGLLGGVYGDPLEELLLLYTMALHHPAFTFDQHTHFGEILEKLKLEDERNRYNPPPITINTAQSTNSCILHTSATPNLSLHPPSVSGLAPMNTLVYVKTPPLQPVVSEQMGELINPVMGMANQPMPPEPLYSIITEGVHTMQGMAAMQHYSMEYNPMGQGHWQPPGHVIMASLNQPIELNFQMLTYPPPSPVLSQPSSPCDSRPASPPALRPGPPAPPHLHQQHRRPSRDTPPLIPHPHPQLHPIPHPHHLVTGFNTLTINERHLEEDKPLLDPELHLKAIAQWQSIENQNGIRRLSGRRGGGGSRGGGGGGGGSGGGSTYCSTQLLRSNLQHQSSGSDSGSSTGSHSPPRQGPSPAPPLVSRSNFPPSYRPGYSPSPFPANGETGYLGAPSYAPGFLPVPLYTPPKLSCWNCGAMGHSGADCKEPSIDDMTRATVYQLDYSTAPPDTNDK